MPACSPNLVADINHLERTQRLGTRLVTGMRHLPYKEWLQRLDLHPLQRRRLRDDLITVFKIFMGLLDIDTFPSSRSTRPKRTPLQGTPRCEPPPKYGVGIFGEGCEILEKAPDFRRYSSFCQCFQETAGESLDRSLSPSIPLTEHSPPLPTCTPPINSYHLYTLPNSLLYICGFFRPVVAYFLSL